jgi:hypothetical protein
MRCLSISRFAASFLLAGVVTVSLPLTVAAQVRDPVVEAQSLFDLRTPATSVAGTLKRDHSRTIAQTTTILRTVGYDARAVVPALRAEFTSSLSTIYGSMRGAGFAARTVSDAFAANGFTLDCIDPQGNPVPCGNFGGTADSPVTGQLALVPATEGQTNGNLSITGSNIPPIFVRLGSTTLTEVNSSSSAVIVRLPSSPMTAHLTMIRKSDTVSGILKKDYRVVSPPLPWVSFVEPAIDGAVAEMRGWLQGARITAGCTVNGALANAVTGAFTSSTGFKGEVRTRLAAAGAPSAVADAWDMAFRAAFSGWATLVTIPALPLFPGLLSVGASGRRRCLTPPSRSRRW